MIFIKPHRPARRSQYNLPGLHIHDQNRLVEIDPRPNDLVLDPNDPNQLNEQGYPRGRLYTPEVDRWRECLKRYREQHPSAVAQMQNVAPEAPNPENENKVNDPATQPPRQSAPPKKKTKQDVFTSLEKRLRKCCISREYEVNLDLEHEGTLFLKVMILRAFQMLTAFGLTFYVQVTWSGEESSLVQPALVKFAFQFSWLLYIGIFLYGILYTVVRFTNAAKYRSLALLIYTLKGIAILMIVFIAGVRWELVVVPTIALTLAIHCLFLGFLPQFKEDIHISKRGSLLLIMTIVEVVLSSVGSWFLVSKMLGNYTAFVSFTFQHENIYSQLFLYCGSTAFAAECVGILDLVEILRILNGRRFAIPNRKSWVRVAASL